MTMHFLMSVLNSVVFTMVAVVMINMFRSVFH